jgi:NAD(P)-dependent dehydrogenase (short-subunit alcohol dehydrogenase family)
MDNPCKEVWETLKINLLGRFIVSKAAIKRMLTVGYGSIIMFSGGGAAYGRSNFNAYGVSKTGVLRMIETIAEELKVAGYPNIIINAIAPGAVKTRMTTEILKAGERAGRKALQEAAKVFESGGTSASRIIDLVDFLIDVKLNNGLTGRLIHVREDYRKLVKKYRKKISDEIGKLRRVPIE